MSEISRIQVASGFFHRVSSYERVLLSSLQNPLTNLHSKLNQLFRFSCHVRVGLKTGVTWGSDKDAIFVKAADLDRL
jgi:hypothetical protein